jgi:hypothetical protein
MWEIALVKTREGDRVGKTGESWMGDWGEVGDSLGRVGWETGKSWGVLMCLLSAGHIWLFQY